jgi:hypothetical protein
MSSAFNAPPDAARRASAHGDALAVQTEGLYPSTMDFSEPLPVLMSSTPYFRRCDVQNLRRQQSNLLESTWVKAFDEHARIEKELWEEHLDLQRQLEIEMADDQRRADENQLNARYPKSPGSWSLPLSQTQALEQEITLLEQAEQKAELLRKQTRTVALELEKTLLKQKTDLLRERQRLVALEFRLMEGQEGSGTDS